MASEKNYDNGKIGEELVKFITEKPFGTIPKRELDIFLFSLLYNNRNSSTKSTPFQISRDLQISQSKVENLIYEMNLREINETPQIKDILKRFSYNEATKTISIPIDNKYEKEFVENVFAENQIIFDGSFNKNLIKLNVDSFAALLYSGLSEEEKNNFFANGVELLQQNQIPKTTNKLGKTKENISYFLTKLLEAGVKISIDMLITNI